MSRSSSGNGFGFLSGVKEFFRRIFVVLKRKPQTVPIISAVVTFLYYSLNLTDVSDTTAKIQGKGMGLCQFCIMLLSILSIVCMLNAFPHRKKVNVPMLLLTFAMYGVMVYCDIHYRECIHIAVNRAESPIEVTAATKYIAFAYKTMSTHMVMTAITVGLIVLMPLYGWLFRKINTSVNVEDNGALEEIDISGEE